MVLNSLVKLNLSYNLFRKIQGQSWEHLKELEFLDVSFNLFDSYPYEEGLLPQLKKIDIRGNSVLELPPFILDSKLQSLYSDWQFMAYQDRKAEKIPVDHMALLKPEEFPIGFSEIEVSDLRSIKQK